MAKKVPPVRPRKKDERAYERSLRKFIIDPYLVRIEKRISETDNLRSLLVQIDEDYERYIDADLRDLPDEVAQGHINKLSAYHKQKLEGSFRLALGVNISPILQDAAMRGVLREAVSWNVDLIKSIPFKFHGDLKERLEGVFVEKGFDRKAIKDTLTGRYKATNSRAKMIARDQTSKTIGALTKGRHQQIGIQEYEWSTAGDERVRSNHSVLNGTIRRWDSSDLKPSEEPMCRCVAIPVIR